MAAALPVDVALIQQPEVRLGDNGRDLEAIVPPLARESPRRQSSKLVVDEPIEGILAAVLPLLQQLGDVGRALASPSSVP